MCKECDLIVPGIETRKTRGKAADPQIPMLVFGELAICLWAQFLRREAFGRHIELIEAAPGRNPELPGPVESQASHHVVAQAARVRVLVSVSLDAPRPGIKPLQTLPDRAEPEVSGRILEDGQYTRAHATSGRAEERRSAGVLVEPHQATRRADPKEAAMVLENAADQRFAAAASAETAYDVPKQTGSRCKYVGFLGMQSDPYVA